MVKSVFQRICGTVAIVAMFGSSAAYAAPASAARTTSVSPIVALSLFASAQSRTALCGVAVASAAAQAAPAQGCVLPAVDAPVPVVETAPPMAEPVAVASGGGISPLLLGLAAIALGVGLYALLKNDDDNAPRPVSP
jgi:hypothetical protein